MSETTNSKRKRPFMDWPFLVILFFAVIGPIATKVYVFYNQVLYTEKGPYLWMDIQDKVSAQVNSNHFGDGYGMREPVEGTASRAYTPYPFENTSEGAEQAAKLVNPLPVTAKTLAQGKKSYQIYCSMCHGDYARAGEAKLRGDHFMPPSLHTKKVKSEWTDGRIYHTISMGQNTMPGYAKQIPTDDRWAIVNYVRVLQRAADASDKDVDKANEVLTAASEETMKEDSKKEGAH